MSNSFLKSNLDSKSGKSSAQRDVFIGVAVNLFVQANDKHFIAGTVILSYEDEAVLCHMLYSPDLLCSSDSSQVVSGSRKVVAEYQGFAYFCLFLSTNEGSKTLGKTYTSGFYVWDRRAMPVAGSADDITPRCSLAAHTSDFEACKMQDNEIVEAAFDLFDEDLQGK